MLSEASLIVPEWPAPASVKALQTTRLGGVSAAPYDSLNLADHSGDDGLKVAHNRQLLSRYLPSEPVWLKQVHGIAVIDAANTGCEPEADATVASMAGAVCAVMTADCLPVLLCDRAGTLVAAAHAGWRGLLGGVIEATVHAMKASPHELMAWLGPAIGPQAFEVGSEVRAAFVAHDANADAAFTPTPQRTGGGGEEAKWLADIYLLAKQRLRAMGVQQIYGGSLCTYSDAGRFFSYRRDGATGRMASLIWLENY